MTAEDRLRDAFRNLSDRANRDVNPANDPSAARSEVRGAGLAGGRRPALLGRPGLAIAGLAVVVAGGAAALTLTGDDGNQPLATDDLTTTTLDVAGTDGTGDGVGATTVPTAPGDGAGTDDAPADPMDLPTNRYRVATARVAADANDPFLNARLAADAGSELLAKLPATYTGLAATGRTETAPDGGTWLEVELLDPVSVTTVDGDTGRPPAGWVNAAFVEALPDGLPVDTAEVPACSGGFDPIDTGSGLGGSGYLYAMESGLVAPDCLRVVLTFGAGGAPFEWYDLPDGTGPADGLPEVFTTMSGGLGASLDLGPTTGAWPGATDTVDAIYAVRSADRTIDLVTPRAVEGVTVVGLPERGIAVIDLDLGSGTAPPAGAGVVLTQPVSVSAGSVDVAGLARPFEATLGVELIDDAGRPVVAVFSGSDFLGTRRTDEYGVGTTDWTEAWGTFAFRVEGLEPGDYTLILDAQGGADDPDTLRLPFTVDQGGDEPTVADSADQEAAMSLVAFARGDNPDSIAQVPLADEVTLALGPALLRTGSSADLADADAWVFDPADGFDGFDGPFSALDQLRRTGLRFTAGAVPHCAGPPRDWPAEFDGLRQVNVEPVGIDSCIQWFGVHLFLDDQDQIAAIALDLYGP